jgi:hypothetical protein
MDTSLFEPSAEHLKLWHKEVDQEQLLKLAKQSTNRMQQARVRLGYVPWGWKAS